MLYTWETDFEIPHIFGVQNTSTMCNLTIPEVTGQAQFQIIDQEMYY